MAIQPRQTRLFISLAFAVFSLTFMPKAFAAITTTGDVSPSSPTSWANLTMLDVGNYGTGSLNITASGSVSSSYCSIGVYSGSQGTVSVAGSGSTLACDQLDVGVLGGGGTLNIDGGGSVRSSYGFIGGIDLSGSKGIVNISGANSLLTASGTLYMGCAGTGTLNQTGGTVTAAAIAFGGGKGTYSLEGGALVVSSLGKKIGLYGVASTAGTAVFNFGGGTLKLTSATTVAIPLTLTGTNGAANVDTNGYAVTLSGTISGIGGLTKLGSGILTLSGTETFTGGINVQAGTLVLTSTETNLASLDVQTAAAAKFTITGGTHTLDAVTGSGTTTVAGSAVLTVACLVQDTLILGGSGAAESSSAEAAETTAVVEITPRAVPEPTTLVLLTALCGLTLGIKRRRR